MEHPKRQFAVTAVASALFLVSGCSGGGSTSAESPTPAPTTSAIAPATGEASFCEAALQWAQSPASADAQRAAQSGDASALVDAYKDWAGPTQAMVDAVPGEAPATVQKAFKDLNDSVQAIAQEGGQSQKQADAYGAAQGKVLDYFDTTCG